MLYDVIVLGATFTAAGIAQKYKEKCLIVERSTLAGYEFLSALNFGTEYTQELKSDAAKNLLEIFKQRDAFNGDRICLYDCATSFYRLLEGKNVLLNTEIISVEKSCEGFVCTVHSVSGYHTYKAKNIIDTRVHDDMYDTKTYNFSVDGVEDLIKIPNVICEKWGFEHNYVLRCSVLPESDFIDARKMVAEYIKNLPEGFKLLAMASDFDYNIKPEYPKCVDGIFYMPSKAYKNPILAFDAGVVFENGGEA